MVEVGRGGGAEAEERLFEERFNSVSAGYAVTWQVWPFWVWTSTEDEEEEEEEEEYNKSALTSKVSILLACKLIETRDREKRPGGGDWEFEFGVEEDWERVVKSPPRNENRVDIV